MSGLELKIAYENTARLIDNLSRENKTKNKIYLTPGVKLHIV